ncbi:aminoglycoside phosphotransferase family protein [Paenibacillus alvei]|uniref:Aminoglycoside phosphotransferase family protein n=2 Tax=Paenibacillus alvei TaxID=44250 RepID=A0ABT4H449_PAEAL|nr:phosphotransferase [Paenibacillus alvei]MCY9763756.1 aminoglycoside phosphotransferase family protein [Paenibacillus alvei]MCY9769990.1 aminoglycoside phosphotransferase family protein [Paenibacillus alvei]
MISERVSAYCTKIPLLAEVTEWALLREWALSEVYRITLRSGETRILKWGGKEMAQEAANYRRLINPLHIVAPRIFDFYESERSAVMIMEDAGKYNLEQQPCPELFLEAARQLARIRDTATMNIEKNMPISHIHQYTETAVDFLTYAKDLLRSPRLADHSALSKLHDIFPQQLERLYHTQPLTLVHHDYHAKNLLIQGTQIMPIDWSISYLSPHLGDLHCLIDEAREYSHVPREEMLSAFHSAMEQDCSMEQLKWQVNIGGLCWLVKTLKWLVYGGTDTIPGSDEWVPDLMDEVELLVNKIV